MQLTKEEQEYWDEYNKKMDEYGRMLNKMCHEAEIKEAYEQGYKVGYYGPFIKEKYNIFEEDWLLSLNNQQLEHIKNIIFKEDDYTVFKQKVEAIKETND